VDTASASQNSLGSPASAVCRPFGSLEPADKKALAYQFVERLGIPSNLTECWWPAWSPKVEFELKKFSDPNTRDRSHRSFLLAGQPGRGKTGYLSAMLKTLFLNFAGNMPNASGQAITRALIRSVDYIHYRDFTKTIRQGFDDTPEVDREYIIDCWCDVGILVIDDLLDGVVKDWDLTRLGEVIDRRYCKKLPTWITTNFSGEILGSWAGFERAFSRLGDESWCRYYVITGPDRRKKIMEDK
jgi:DNA replication protein DnaC